MTTHSAPPSTVQLFAVPPARTFEVTEIGEAFAAGKLYGNRPAVTATSELPRRATVGSRFCVLEVSPGDPTVVSAAGADLVASLFYGVTPELRSGTVRVMAVARRAGQRSKIAVASTEPGVDAVAALIGRGANRVRYVGTLLGGERVEVIAYHDDMLTFASNALAPANVARVDVAGDGLRAHVRIDQRSAAVGGAGLNTALAAELVGRPIDVVST